MTAYRHLNASQNSPESQLFLLFPWKWSAVLPFGGFLFETPRRAQRARRARRTQRGGLLCRLHALQPHTQPRSLCGQAALMLGFSYLAPGKVNEVVALFLRK